MDSVAAADILARLKAVVGPKGVVEASDAEPYF